MCGYTLKGGRGRESRMMQIHPLSKMSNRLTIRSKVEMLRRMSDKLAFEV